MGGFFNVIAKRQTYLNMFYLLIAFPLGIFYFSFLITGVSLGLGLIITLFGIPLLFLMTFLWYWLGTFEARLSSALLNIKIVPEQSKAFKEKTFFKKITKHFTEPITWKSFGYLLIKFPLGILSFVLLVTLLSVSLSLLVSPLLYYLAQNIISMDFIVINGVSIIIQAWQVWLISVVGLFLLFVSLHVFNGLAYVSGIIAKSLLGSKKVIRKKKKVKHRQEATSLRKRVKRKVRKKRR